MERERKKKKRKETKRKEKTGKKGKKEWQSQLCLASKDLPQERLRGGTLSYATHPKMYLEEKRKKRRCTQLRACVQGPTQERQGCSQVASEDKGGKHLG
jgi:hypothetical protein